MPAAPCRDADFRLSAFLPVAQQLEIDHLFSGGGEVQCSGTASDDGNGTFGFDVYLDVAQRLVRSKEIHRQANLVAARKHPGQRWQQHQR